ncbi:MAG: FtsX-like permease family protein [Lachnospiraceae bacterium]|nr:FtsX-like permease family protein [Lachnospiraceae bacterium]
MQALIFIAKNNIKKKKGETGVLFFLIALATLLLYTSISVFSEMGTVLDKAYDSAHTCDYMFLAPIEKQKISGILSSQEEVAEYEISRVIWNQDVKYRMSKAEEKKEMSFILGRIEEERKIGKTGNDIKQDSKNEILLPYYMKVSEKLHEGDEFYLTLGSKEYKFIIAGFVEDPLFATPLNCNAYRSYISKVTMDRILKENNAVKSSTYTEYKLRLKEGESSFDFDKKISAILTQKVPQLSQTVNLGLNWESMRGGDMVMSNISMSIILVFSLLLIVVVLIIIRFSIYNFMEMNRKNIGILQAAGYTSRQLTLSTILEMGMTTVGAVVVGILLGIAGSGIIGNFQGMMLGVHWSGKVHFPSIILTILVVFAVVLGVSWLCGRSCKKITVLESLRGGICTHNFKRNHFSFEKSRLPKNLIFTGKNLFNEKGKTVSIFCIVALLAFSACVGLGLYENFAIGEEQLLKMVGAEAGNIGITGKDLEHVGKKMEHWDEVERVLYYNNISVHLESGKDETDITCDVWKKPDQVKNEMVLEGRLPKYDNEIILSTNVAKILEVHTGDTIYVTGEGERLDYVVSGLDQKMNNMGLKAIMTEKGAKRLNETSYTTALYVYTKDGIDYGTISKKVLKNFSGVSVLDSKKQIENVMASVTLAMVAICVIFVLITIFVVTIVEVLLIRSKTIKEWKNLGIQKALGYTTRELIGQMMMTNLPVIAAGAVLGVVLSNFFMEPLLVACLSYCGIQKCPFSIHPIWMLVTVIGIILVAIITSFLSSVKIRKIQPVQMLTEE